MKIALIRRQFSATGGAELYLQRLLKALQESGHETHLFAEAWDDPPPGVTFHPVVVTASRAWRATRFAEAVQGAVAAQPFDCVFSLDRTLRQDVYRAGDGVHRVWLQRRRQFTPWWRTLFLGWSKFHRNMMDLERRTFDRANTGHVIVNSMMVRREILANFSFPAERIHLVRNGIEVERFMRGNREETRKRFGFGPNDLVLLFVGSGWERKGLGKLIKAFLLLELEIFSAQKILPSEPSWIRPNTRVKLLVVGKGSLTTKPSASVVFAGPMPEVENAYAAADLFVFPPIYEPSSNVVIEALAAGLPVITTAQNGASEWIDEGQNGTVIDSPDNTAGLREAMKEWLGRLARKTAPDWAGMSLERNVKDTLAVLEFAASERKPQP